MTRGITEVDVWTACDALLIDGERPTIERVRHRIGRGSPNTVSPYLDTWFRSLGARIDAASPSTAGSALPDTVRQAAQQLWQSALDETRRDFDQRLQESMAAAVANVEAEKERASLADAAAFEAVGRANRLQTALDERSESLDEQRIGRATAEARLSDARRRIDDLLTRLESADAARAELRESAERELAAATERCADAEQRAALATDAERALRARTDDKIALLERRLAAAQLGATEQARQLAGCEALLASQRSQLDKATETVKRAEQSRTAQAAIAQQLLVAARSNSSASTAGNGRRALLPVSKRLRNARAKR